MYIYIYIYINTELLEVAERVLRIKHGAVDIQFSHSSTIDGPRLTFTSRAHIVRVFYQSLIYATARLVDQQHALRAQDGVSIDTTITDSPGTFARFLGEVQVITRNQELGHLHVNTAPFTSHTSLPHLELGDTLLLAVCDEYPSLA